MELFAVCCLEGHEGCQHPRIPDAIVMVEDRVQWKRDVAAHATPQECMLRE